MDAGLGQNGLYQQNDPYAQHGAPGQGGFGEQNAPYAMHGQEGQPGTGDRTMAWDGQQPGGQDPYAEFGAPAGQQGFDQPGPGGPGEFGHGRRSGFDSSGNSGGNKKLLIIGGGVGGVVLLGLGVLLFGGLGGGSPSKAAASGPATPSAGDSSAASPTASPTPSIDPTAPLGAKLKSRTTDPDPLTPDEVFKNHDFGKYSMTASGSDSDCSKDVHGKSFLDAIKKGDCTQLLRATYVTSDGKIMGTVGIANLSSAAAASKAAKASSGTDAYLMPLPGDSGPSKKMNNKAIAQGSAEAKGHYLILTWVQRSDGKAFASNQTGAIKDFVTQVPLGSNLDNALQYRGISGKAYGT
jgi:hypothetical protein